MNGPTASGELERLAAACLFPGFVGVDRPPDWVLRWAEAGLGGVVLFSRNVGGEEEIRALTGALHEAGEHLLVAIDEEGGDVTRLEAERGSSYPGNAALGVIDDVELTRAVATAMGADLRDAGVDLDLAPVADVNTEPHNPVIGIRSFGSDPELVSRHVAAFVEGIHASGVAACAKHFPGHGDTRVDSHLGLPVVDADRRRLQEEALPPFRAAVAAGVTAIMTAHLVVPALDDVPATVSRMILEGLLRDELGFDGLVITDALEMRGISGTVGVEEGAVRALAAGADALCLGHDLGVESVERVHTAIVEAVHSGRLAPARLEQAARRIEQTRVAVPTVANGRRIPDVGLRAARRAIRTEGGVRLTRSPLVLELWPVPSIAAGRAGASLGGVLSERLPVTEVADLTGAPDDDAKVLAAAARRERQLVLVVRDAHRHAWERQAVETLLAAVPDAVVVELGLPLWRPPGSVALVAAYGAGRANLTAVAEMLAGGEV